MKRLIALFIAVLVLSQAAFAQSEKKVTELPDISVIGNFLGTHSDSKKEFNVSELEFAFKHYLYPDVKADVFLGLHKNDEGKRNLELEEGYITFFNFFGTLFPNYTPNLGIGAVVGKKLISVGKLNPTHPESWYFVDKALVLKQFFGKSHGISGEGAQLSYALPFLPFFSQVEAGYWGMTPHEEEEGGHEGHGVEYSNSVTNARLWNSFSVSDTQEFQLGLSYLLGNADSEKKSEQQEITGVDLTYTLDLNQGKSLKLQSEMFRARYAGEGEAKREEQTGAYLSAIYNLSAFYNVGLRYGVLGTHGDEGEEKNQTAISFTRQLTESSKFRFQYNTGEGVEDTIYAQFVFGMGPGCSVSIQ